MFASGVSSADSSSTTSDSAAVQAALSEGVSLNPPLQAANVSVTTTSSSAQVTVTYDFPFLVSWPGRGPSLTITRSVTMPIIPLPGS